MGGRLFKGKDYFKKFPSKEAIIRGTAIIRGNTVSTDFSVTSLQSPYLEKKYYLNSALQGRQQFPVNIKTYLFATLQDYPGSGTRVPP